MTIEVKFFSLLRLELKEAGCSYQLDDEITVKELIKLLDQDYEGIFSDKLIEAGQIKMGTIILVDGDNVIHLNGLETVIKDGAKISIFPPSGGG